MPAPALRRPVTVTVAVVLVALSGATNTAFGLLLLLSRYDVPAADVVTVSLLGVGIVLFGLLTLAIASGLARGSALSRLLLTIYLAVQFVLHIVTIVASDTWDWTAVAQILVEIVLMLLIWTPPGARHFRAHAPARDPYDA